MKVNKNGLTDKQEKFVNELIKGKSQRAAYRNAYPNAKKWKNETVDSKASTLLKNGKVKERYEQLKEKVTKNAENKAIISAEKIIDELANIALSNIGDFIVVKGKSIKLKKLEEIDQKKLSALNLKPTQYGYEVEFKQSDKIKALKMLGEHFGIFEKEDSKGQYNITINHSIPRPNSDEDVDEDLEEEDEC